MAKGPQYNLPFRRRREGRTHYGKRRALVSSGSPRLVVRPSIKHITAQIVEARPDGDHVIVSANSAELREFGWKVPYGNLPAAYLTGLLAGHRAKSKGINEAILDIGLHARNSGSRIFAAAKGALEAGLMIPHGEEALPAKGRLKGEHIVSYAKQLSSNAEVYKRTFSVYLKNKVKPEEIAEHVTTVETKINASAAEVRK